MELPRFSPRRELGQTGFVATSVGIGDLADPELGLEACVALARRALDAGLNVIDTAPNYSDGLSERIVGAAVGPRRGEVFVIDKIDRLDEEVLPQVDASIERLGFAPDLFVFHSVSREHDWERRMTELEAARAKGKCRFRGISSHDPDIVRRAIESRLCDVVMFAVGPYVDARYTDELLPLARERRVGVVSFKTLGAGKLVADSKGYGEPSEMKGLPRLTVEECVRATLTFDPDVALIGMSTEAEQDAALTAVARFAPFPPQEQAAVLARAKKSIENKGECWWNPERTIT